MADDVFFVIDKEDAESDRYQFPLARWSAKDLDDFFTGYHEILPNLFPAIPRPPQSDPVFESLFTIGEDIDTVFRTRADAEEAIRKACVAIEHWNENYLIPNNHPWAQARTTTESEVESSYAVAWMSRRDWYALREWVKFPGFVEYPRASLRKDGLWQCDYWDLFELCVVFKYGLFRVNYAPLYRLLSDKERATLSRIKPAFEKAGSHSFSEMCKLADVDRKTARKFQRLGLLPFLSTQAGE